MNTLPKIRVDGKYIIVHGHAFVRTKVWGWMLSEAGRIGFLLPKVDVFTTGILLLRQHSVNNVRLALDIPMEPMLLQDSDYILDIIYLYPDGRCLLLSEYLDAEIIDSIMGIVKTHPEYFCLSRG